MKVSRFLSYFRTTALCGLALAAIGGVAFTLSSCGGGGGGNESTGGFVVTPQQFAAGKAFYIMANNVWTLRATDPSGLIQPPTDTYSGAVSCLGEITTGDYENEDAGRAVVYFTYSYNQATNTGKLSWSWDSSNENNTPTPSLAFVTSIHNLAGGQDNGGNNNNNGGGNEEEMGGIGEEGNQVSLAEHYAQAFLLFDFNHGTCLFHCPCGAQSQTIPFSVRAN